jgi:hypothetical protein
MRPLRSAARCWSGPWRSRAAVTAAWERRCGWGRTARRSQLSRGARRPARVLFAASRPAQADTLEVAEAGSARGSRTAAPTRLGGMRRVPASSCPKVPGPCCAPAGPAGVLRPPARMWAMRPAGSFDPYSRRLTGPRRSCSRARRTPRPVPRRPRARHRAHPRVPRLAPPQAQAKRLRRHRRQPPRQPVSR